MREYYFGDIKPNGLTLKAKISKVSSLGEFDIYFSQPLKVPIDKYSKEIVMPNSTHIELYLDKF